MIYGGLFLMSGTNLAKYSAIMPREKNIRDDTNKIKVIIKNWYLKTNNFNEVNTRYKINIIKENKKFKKDKIVIKCKSFVLKENIPFKPILNDPVNLLYFVDPLILGSLSNSIILCENPI